MVASPAAPPQARLLIGWGNPLRQDDGAGWWLAHRLAQEELPGLTCLAVPQLTPELAEAIAASDAVLFVDACRPGPGPQAPLGLEPLAATPALPAPQRLSHRFGAPALLALALQLYGHGPPAWQLLIPMERDGFGETLSHGVAAQLDQATGLARAWSQEPLHHA